MKNALAAFISAISSPFLIVGGFGLWCVGANTHTLNDFALYGALCVFLLGGLPFIYILINIKLGRITDIHVALREQRAMPFVVATIGALILTATYTALGAPRQLIALAFTTAVSGVIFGLLTQVSKLSVHSAAYTGAVIIVAFTVNTQLLWLLALLPVIIWARLVRKKHSPIQAVAATLLNALFVTVTLTLLLH